MARDVRGSNERKLGVAYWKNETGAGHRGAAKGKNALVWRMNSIRACAKEIVEKTIVST